MEIGPNHRPKLPSPRPVSHWNTTPPTETQNDNMRFCLPPPARTGLKGDELEPNHLHANVSEQTMDEHRLGSKRVNRCRIRTICGDRATGRHVGIVPLTLGSRILATLARLRGSPPDANRHLSPTCAETTNDPTCVSDAKYCCVALHRPVAALPAPCSKPLRLSQRLAIGKDKERERGESEEDKTRDQQQYRKVGSTNDNTKDASMNVKRRVKRRTMWTRRVVVAGSARRPATCGGGFKFLGSPRKPLQMLGRPAVLEGPWKALEGLGSSGRSRGGP